MPSGPRVAPAEPSTHLPAEPQASRGLQSARTEVHGSQAGVCAVRPAETPSVRRLEQLRLFLHAYWLRPENALWMTLRSMALDQVPWQEPAIDVSCGDGLFSFLHHGGLLDPSFDVFASLRALPGMGDARTDMFNQVDDEYRPAVLAPPGRTISTGTDLKPTLLAKAQRLSLYDSLRQHDNNRAFPFPDGTFQTVYCNAAYWVKDIGLFLRELARVIHPQGRVILQVKLTAMRNYTLEGFRDVLGDRFLRIIGRGRFETWPTLADRLEWERRFRQAGLNVLEAVPLATATHAHLWDVGLRPFAPLLVRLAEAIEPTTRQTIKTEWVELCLALLEPFCDPTVNLLPDAPEPAEIQYVLRHAGA